VVPEDGALHSVLVANFDPAATEVEISPRSEQKPSASPKKVPVGGRSVTAVDLASLGGSGGPFAVDVRTTRPSSVVVEELASWGPPNAATGSATSLASPVRARGWTFAVGRLAPEDVGTISVFNPSPGRTTVKLFAFASGGGASPGSVGEVAVPARSQAQFDLGDLGVAPDQVVVVRADAPVVAARRILGPTGASLALGVAEP
jgi:hypothetical protein